MNADEVALRFLLHPRSRALYEQWAMLRPVPDLHHYTTATGLEGIFSSATIWATEARHLNDTSELTYAEELIRQTLVEQLPLLQDEYRPWMAEFAHVVKRVITAQRVFVASFCEQRDLLSQWRAYGSAGYCITFNGQALAALSHCHIVRVIYDPDEQRQIIRETAALHLDAVKLARRGTQADINRVSGNFGAQLALYAAAFKNPAFAEEKEWRALSSGDVLRVRVREVIEGEAPYVSIPLAFGPKRSGKLPVKSVMLAPSSDARLLIELRQQMERFGYDQSLATASLIPLRARAGA